MEKAQRDTFDYANCLQWLDNCIKSYEQCKDIPTEDLCSFLHEFCNVFRMMGKLLSVAFSDVEEKVQVLRSVSQSFKAECNGMLLANVRKEVSLGIARLNGENNKKETKDPQYAKYNSLSRNLLRMMWFQNYLKVMFEQLTINREQKTSKAFQKAYDDAFSTHHSFIVKTGAGLAMSAAPSRERIKQILLGPNGTDDQVYPIFEALYKKLDQVKTIQWNFYEENKLTELP